MEPPISVKLWDDEYVQVCWTQKPDIYLEGTVRRCGISDSVESEVDAVIIDAQETFYPVLQSIYRFLLLHPRGNQSKIQGKDALSVRSRHRLSSTCVHLLVVPSERKYGSKMRTALAFQ